MRVWFIPLLFLSILIGWTLGLTACARSAEQGWVPVPLPERMELPRPESPYGHSVDGMRRPSLGEPERFAPDASEPATDAGTPAMIDASAPPAKDAGEPRPDAGSVWDLTRRCGDGVVQLGEGCDDGNELGGDGCSALCAVE